jgi:selenocysteine lyase/cysteine desulfurase
MGILYGRFDLLEELAAYKVRPASDDVPWKWETGTPSFEGIAGILGALEYFAWLGEEFGAAYPGGAIKQGLAAAQDYEAELSKKLLEILGEVPGLKIYGLDDPADVVERVPTFAVNLEGKSPRQVAELLNERGIYVWDGNYYAICVTERLGVEETGGMVRIGAAHYNTIEEIERLGEALVAISRE